VAIALSSIVFLIVFLIVCSKCCRWRNFDLGF
jgi:hypothetical protein